MSVEKENLEQESNSVGMSGFFNKLRLTRLEQQIVLGKPLVITMTIDYQCSAKEIARQINRTTNNK